jgi:YVTN family beta-propeller protein
MPPVIDPANLYSETRAGKLSPAVQGALPYVYVPHVQSSDVYVIDPETLKVVRRFNVGLNPQHIVPSWDLKTLWVANNAENTTKGSLTPINPLTGKPGTPIKVDDPYNMYFTPDGKEAIIVAERCCASTFRDPQTMELKSSLPTPQCKGINHADFSIDGRYAIFTCEFNGSLVKIDMVERKVLGYLKLSTGRMPQDIRISPDGTTFYVADMMADGVFVVDGASFKEIGFVKTGKGTHGLYPSRDGRKLYITNRGSNKVHGAKGGMGSVSVLDFATRTVDVTGRSRAAAAPTWATSAPMAVGCGCPAATTTWSTCSTRPAAR